MSRKLTAQEIQIHQFALARPDQPLTDKDVATIISNPQARLEAMNFLTAAGLFKVLQDKETIQWKVLSKQELDAKKGLTGEETIVLNHISASGNKGIWTKHLKAKTELHQTVIDRCLKSLTSKGLIKAVKSVQHSTRKIFMLAHLEPSVEMTGGPWYTDNELDTEFIKLLSSACLHFIRERSFPKRRTSANKQLYAISAAPAYPSTKQVAERLQKAKVTDTNLSVDDVEALLNILVLDGEIEKIPAFGAAMWDASNIADDADDGESSDDDTDQESTKKKKKKKKTRDGELKKRKRAAVTSSEDSSEHEGESSDDEDSKKRKKKTSSKHSSKKKRKRDETESSEDSGSSEEEKRKKKKSNKRKKHRSYDTDDDSSDESESAKSRKKKKKKRSAPPSSESESDSEDSPPPKPKKKSSSSKTKPKKERSPSPAAPLDIFSSAYVYRAISQERIHGLGLSQAPCGACPVFEFCKDKGPVNPGECTYYTEWLERGEVVNEA